MGLLDGKIAKLVDKSIKKAKLYKPAVLIRETAGVRTPGSYSAGTNPITVSYACRGLVGTFATDDIDGTLIIATDLKVTLLGASLPAGIVPTDGDSVTIEGATYSIVHVDRDPASAVYELVARK